jgi:hypothetical protein
MGQRFVGALCLAAMAVAGCGDDDTHLHADAGPDTGTADAPHGGALGVVEGRLFHALTLEPLAGAQVKVTTDAGEEVVTTDAQGKFETNAPMSQQAKVSSEAYGQVATMKTVAVHEGEASYVELFSMPVGKQTQVDATTGGTVEGPLGASIKLPPDGLAHADGSPVTGMVDVAITPMLPQDPKQLAAKPGKAMGKYGDGTEAKLSPWASMAVTLKQGAAEVNLATGQQAELKMPVADPAAPKTMVLWSLNEVAGEWDHEGALSKVSTQTGAVYKGHVSHFSFWSGERPLDATTCVRGCVTGGSGAARVVALGVDALFREEATTDRDGCFAVDVPVGGRVRLQAAGRNGSSGRMVVEVAEGSGSADDPSTCQDVGALDMVPAQVQDEGCPLGMKLCNGRCADTSSDTLHCGGCGTNCTAAEGLEGLDGVACVEGACGCPPSRPTMATDLDGNPEACVDALTDERHCGDPPVECADTEECVDGVCVALECPDGTDACQVCDEFEVCRTECIDPDDDARHCGGCLQLGGVDCSFELSGSACIQGTCECPSGSTLCDIPDVFVGCVDLSSDMEHCGACGSGCYGEFPGYTCMDGQCTCEGALTDCYPDDESFAFCVDTQWDSYDCGGCGEEFSCFDGYCVEGTCVTELPECDGNLTYCQGECVDVTTSAEHCGYCGNACGPNEVCSSEGTPYCACDPNDPTTTEQCRGEGCIDLTTDTRHCGRCDNACGIGQRCEQGVCVF